MQKWIKMHLLRIAGSFGNKQIRALLYPTEQINNKSSVFHYDSHGFTVTYKEFLSK